MEELSAYLEALRPHLCHWFTVDDLMYLKRGGRISASTALLGTALQIKPVMHTDNDGKLANVSKARGRKASIRALVDRMEQTAIDPASQTVFICHGDCIEDAEYAKKLIQERFGIQDIVINFTARSSARIPAPARLRSSLSAPSADRSTYEVPADIEGFGAISAPKPFSKKICLLAVRCCEAFTSFARSRKCGCGRVFILKPVFFTPLP